MRKRRILKVDDTFGKEEDFEPPEQHATEADIRDFKASLSFGLATRLKYAHGQPW